MKRILIWLLLLCVILVFTSCKSNSQDLYSTSARGKTTTITSQETSSLNNTTPPKSTSQTMASSCLSTTTHSKTTTVKHSTSTTQSSLIQKEPLPDGVVCGYEWLNNFARAATEEELLAYQKSKNLSDDLIWCEHCGRPVVAMTINGEIMLCGAIYGTCMRHIGNSNWKCECCNAVVPAHTCHTCGIPVEIESLPGTIVNSPDQLNDVHKERLQQIALNDLKKRYELKDDETLISLYSFVLTDDYALSSKSKCVCFFVFTSTKPYSSTPVYHSGEIIDMYFQEDGLLRCSTISNEFVTYENEEEVIASYQKIGYDIRKII